MNQEKWDLNYKKNWENLPWCFEKIPSWFSSSVMKLDKNSVKDVLDLWCWVWNYSNFLSECWFNVLGVDFSKEAINLARSKYKENEHLKFMNADVLNDDLGNENFDLVCDISLFHHIPPVKKPLYIQKVYNALREHWKFILSCFDIEDIWFNHQPIFKNEETNTIMYPLDKSNIDKLFWQLFSYEVQHIAFWKNNRKRFLINMKKL